MNLHIHRLENSPDQHWFPPDRPRHSSAPLHSAQQSGALEPLVHIGNQFFTEVPQSLVNVELQQILPQARAYMNDLADLRRNLVTFPKVLQHFMNRGLLHHLWLQNHLVWVVNMSVRWLLVDVLQDINSRHVIPLRQVELLAGLKMIL